MSVHSQSFLNDTALVILYVLLLFFSVLVLEAVLGPGFALCQSLSMGRCQVGMASMMGASGGVEVAVDKAGEGFPDAWVLLLFVSQLAFLI